MMPTFGYLLMNLSSQSCKAFSSAQDRRCHWTGLLARKTSWLWLCWHLKLYCPPGPKDVLRIAKKKIKINVKFNTRVHKLKCNLVLRDFLGLEGNNGNSHLRMEINIAVLDCTCIPRLNFACGGCMHEQQYNATQKRLTLWICKHNEIFMSKQQIQQDPVLP